MGEKKPLTEDILPPQAQHTKYLQTRVDAVRFTKLEVSLGSERLGASPSRWKVPAAGFCCVGSLKTMSHRCP